MPDRANVLAILGIILSIPPLYRLVSFVWLYFLRPSSIKQYLHGSTPYAVVTGATDGIGKATAAELLKNGFNLIIHGRNEQKMRKVVDELRHLVPAASNADIRYFIADASKPGHDFAKIVEPYKDLNVTFVLHNVGGSDITSEKLDGHSEEYLMGMLHKNALFSLFLTRALLPQLRQNARSGPILVQFMGSLAGDIAPPGLVIYAASKGFLKSLVHGLDNDELYLDKESGVRFAYLTVGPVYSENHDVPMPVDAKTPTCEVFAKALLARSGCGMRNVTPYVVHAVVNYLVGFARRSTVDGLSAAEMRTLTARAKKGH